MENFPKIPGYTIIKKIGEGATALVFLGISDISNRNVAIKVLKPVLQLEKEYSYRFLREARIVKKLNHPNIIKIYEVGQPGEYYIVMECIEDNLDAKIHKGIGLTEKEVIRIFKKIAGGLQYAHSRKIIHRDIKPPNILFRRDGTPVLTDFGLARMTDSQTNFTKTGTIMGTPAYMSPEQCSGKKVNYLSDIYSLGVVLFEMLTGSLPYRAQSILELYEKHKNSPIPQLPPGLKKYQPIIKCMMAKDRKNRIRSAGQVSIMLDKLSSRRKKKELINTTEILSANNKFFQNYKKWFLSILLIVTTIALLVVIIMIFNMGGKSSTQIKKNQSTGNTSINTHRLIQNFFTKSFEKAFNSGPMNGKISFSPEECTHHDIIRIQLNHENLESSRGDKIPSDIYYTIDDSDPTKENGRKYTLGEIIVLSRPGVYTIKARLFSKRGKYEGVVYWQKYIIRNKD